jgi:hypothetical protein
MSKIDLLHSCRRVASARAPPFDGRLAVAGRKEDDGENTKPDQDERPTLKRRNP